jgi:hypothetical protein
MESNQNNTKWRENLEEVFLACHRKVYFLIFSFLALLFVGLSIKGRLMENKSIGYVIGALISQLATLAVLLYLATKINSKKYGDLFFTCLLMIVDVNSFVLCYFYKDNESVYSVLLYHFLCYAVMFMNIKQTIRKSFSYFVLF